MKEYWVAFPRYNIFIVYTMLGGKYNTSMLIVAGGYKPPSALDGFLLDLFELFAHAQ